jgi:hypothetical protein
MNMLEITLFLFNILLIVVIIAVYIKLSFVIKQQGFQISVLLKHDREAFKEAMSPAQRWTKAAKYAKLNNGLMPSGERITVDEVEAYEASNERGDRPMSYLIPENSSLNITKEEALKSGANAIGGSGFDSSVSVPDTSALPAETQTGVINNETTDPNNFSLNPRVSPSFLETSTTFAPNEGSQERYRARRNKK